MTNETENENGVLDRRFFQLLEQREGDVYVDQAYRVIHPQSTAVLFASDNKTPVAAVAMLADFGEQSKKQKPTKKKSIQTVLSSRRTNRTEQSSRDGSDVMTTVHALCNTEGCRIKFVLHNLTHFELPTDTVVSETSENIAYIKIDLLTRDIVVEEVDLPALSVNQVNEVRPSESIIVECDQRTQREMILRSCKAVESTCTTSSSGAVQEEPLKSFESAQGTRVYVNVVASKRFPKLVSLLQNSQWRDADVIVRRITKPKQTRPKPVQRLSSSCAHITNWSESSVVRSLVVQEAHVQLKLENAKNNQRKINAIMKDEAKRLKRLERLKRQKKNRIAKEKKEFEAIRQKVAKEKKQALVSPSSEQTAQILLGNVVDKPSAFYTGHGYDFDTIGHRMCLNVSVWSKLPQLCCLTEAEAREEAFLQFKDIRLDEVRKQLECVSVYKVDECVICMQNPSNIVYLQCGHQCECSECSPLMETKQCPTCRRPIKARVDVSELPEFSANV